MAGCNSVRERIEEAFDIKRTDAKKTVVVEVSYLDFEFDSLNEAVLFADLANKSLTEDTTNRKVKITVMYEEDDEE